jgi:hypothetical protein
MRRIPTRLVQREGPLPGCRLPLSEVNVDVHAQTVQVEPVRSGDPPVIGEVVHTEYPRHPDPYRNGRAAKSANHPK